MSEPARVTEVVDRVQPHRRIDGIAAVFLPFDEDGRPDHDAFAGHVRRTHDAGLVCAVNMDTGFGPQLGAEVRDRILAEALDLVGGARVVAGAICDPDDHDPAAGHRRAVEAVAARGGVPIVFQTTWLTGGEGQAIASRYAAICRGAGPVLGFELGPVFAPFGRIYDVSTFERLLQIEELSGLKHSSLSRTSELHRLAIRDAVRPGFSVYTGNDLAIDMVCYGSDYLLGLATFDPAAFAERDRLWAAGDARFYEVNDALQAVGAIAFRDPVPAYKASCAAWLDLTGQIPGARPHPSTPARPPWEAEMLAPLAERLDAALGR